MGRGAGEAVAVTVGRACDFGGGVWVGKGDEAVDPAAQNWPETHGVTREQDGEEQKLPRGQRVQVTLEVELQGGATYRPRAQPPQLVHAVALEADE